MKKVFVLILGVLLLCGCAANGEYETVNCTVPVVQRAPRQQIYVQLPGDLTVPVIAQEEEGTLYECSEYTLTLQTMEGGDLERTLLNCTGFSSDNLKVITTQRQGITRHTCAWTAAGEGGPQVGRLAVLDDGSWHYVLCVMADAQMAGDLESEWKHIFDTFRLESQTELFSSGS